MPALLQILSLSHKYVFLICILLFMNCNSFITSGRIPSRILSQHRRSICEFTHCNKLYGGKIEELSDEGEEVQTTPVVNTGPTDEELGKSHGYEGDFKVGDVVKVLKAGKSGKIWSVKPYTKEGFDPVGLIGKVSALVLYGRKMKSLCSAITPIKVEFDPKDPSILAKGLTFERKFTIHFCAEELERA